MALTVTSLTNKGIWSPLPFSSFKGCCSSSSSQLQLSLSPLNNTPFEHIENSGVIACLRANSADLAMEAARAAIAGGISVLEIVMSTPGFTVSGAGLSYHDLRGTNLQLLLQLRTCHKGSLWAQTYCAVHETDKSQPIFWQKTMVGTVLNVEDAKKARKAGAKFLMSPATVKEIMDDVQGREALYIPGVMTPTEILSAHDAGAKIVKIYPVSALGGTHYISALKKPFPNIPMVASQGITIDSIADYIAQGATAVVLSDAIFNREAMGQNNFDAIYQLASLAALQGKEAVQWKSRCIPD